MIEEFIKAVKGGNIQEIEQYLSRYIGLGDVLGFLRQRYRVVKIKTGGDQERGIVVKKKCCVWEYNDGYGFEDTLSIDGITLRYGFSELFSIHCGDNKYIIRRLINMNVTSSYTYSLIRIAK